MQLTEPNYYIVSLGEGFHKEFYKFLEDNKIKWRPDANISYLENLYEFAGRLCYESWKVDGEFTNKNLTKVREGNKEYLENILKVNHGSVLEHGNIVILFNNVSRVFTHELVRHRVGTAMSQTSGRYVRNDDIKIWIPEPFVSDADAMEKIKENILQTENLVKYLTDRFKIDEMKNFKEKKEITSSLRRFTPNGMSNNILFSFNGRSLKHVLNLRTSEGAELEMRTIFRKLQERMKKEFPNLMQDML
jgi:thymidylate synthase (FAD)